MAIREARMRVAGVAVLCFCILAFIGEVRSMSRLGFVDAPASDRQDGECLKGYSDGSSLYWEGKPLDLRSARMFLSINFFPRDFYGGTILANRAESTDAANVGGDLRLLRRGDLLIVNGVDVPSGKLYTRKTIHWAFRLWALPSTLTEIRNRGVFHCFRTQEGTLAMNALYARGRVKGGWTPSPTGPILLVAGICFIIKSRSKTKDIRKTRVRRSNILRKPVSWLTLVRRYDP